MKHAFLIIAHKMDETFKTLIEMLDYNNNDIFIHMDKKVKFCHDELICKQSRLFFTERISVGWGGYSLIKVELLLLKKATMNENIRKITQK